MLLIWSNTGEWGGVNILNMRFAEYLRARDVDFVIAEPAGNRMRDDLPWARFVELDEVSELANTIDCVLMSSVAMLRDIEFPWRTLGTARLFTWDVQPNSPVTSFVPLAYQALRALGYPSLGTLFSLIPKHRRLVSDMFNLLIRGGSLAVMDEANRRSLQYFYPQSNAALALTVPVPAPLGPRTAAKALSPSILTVGYLGRIDPMKWSALGPFITNHLAEMARTRPVRLFAVCEGAGVPLLERTCSNAGVGLQLNGFLPNSEARRLIQERSHFAVAMGTSALDLAAVGHPCLLLDPAVRMGARPQTLFRFIHETEGHTLGEFRDFPHYHQGLRTFRESVSAVENGDIGDDGRAYVADNHDPEQCFSSLRGGISDCTTTVEMIAPFALAIEHSIVAKNKYYGWIRRLIPLR